MIKLPLYSEIVIYRNYIALQIHFGQWSEIHDDFFVFGSRHNLWKQPKKPGDIQTVNIGDRWKSPNKFPHIWKLEKSTYSSSGKLKTYTARWFQPIWKILVIFFQQKYGCFKNITKQSTKAEMQAHVMLK